MNIDKNHVVRFHYSVAVVGQPSNESSFGGEPVTILTGHRNIIPGLEAAMMGRAKGDRFEVTVPSAEAYGAREEGRVQRVPKKHFGKQRLVPGGQAIVQTNAGARAVTVLKVGLSVVDVDLNHPMAGQDLHFDIEILDVREAAKEEVDHGHVHGEGGVEH